jgi:hypothetical protein
VCVASRACTPKTPVLATNLKEFDSYSGSAAFTVLVYRLGGVDVTSKPGPENWSGAAGYFASRSRVRTAQGMKI